MRRCRALSSPVIAAHASSVPPDEPHVVSHIARVERDPPEPVASDAAEEADRPSESESPSPVHVPFSGYERESGQLQRRRKSGFASGEDTRFSSHDNKVPLGKRAYRRCGVEVALTYLPSFFWRPRSGPRRPRRRGRSSKSANAWTLLRMCESSMTGARSG